MKQKYLDATLENSLFIQQQWLFLYTIALQYQIFVTLVMNLK